MARRLPRRYGQIFKTMTKETTTRTRVCVWCGRTLPVTAFPLKTGMTRARYKTCRECHALGHSCLRKERPKRERQVLTPEQKAEKLREYRRKYYQEHKENFNKSNREWYNRKKKGEPKQKPGPKPKLKKEHEKRKCIVCDRVLPMDAFISTTGKRTHSTVCLYCREQRKQKKELCKSVVRYKPGPPKEEPKERGCLRCSLYPCFQGIENLESDFSRTCKSFNQK